MRANWQMMIMALVMAMCEAVGSLGFMCALKGAGLGSFSTGEIMGILFGMTGVCFGLIMLSKRLSD